MMKQVKLHQDFGFKLVGASDIDPRDVLEEMDPTEAERISAEDPSIVDINSISDDAATVIYIEGYASVFVNEDGSRLEDRDGESVSIALLDIENYKKNPILVYNHNWSDVAGKIIEIRKDAKGLYVRAEVHKFTGREQVFEAVQKDILRTFSIGFVPKTFTYIEDEDIFEISSAELVEISLAPVPSNQDSIFIATSQKSLAVSKKMLKEQNNLSCDEVNGICSMTKTKGLEMKTKTVEQTPEEALEAARALVAAADKDVAAEVEAANVLAAAAETVTKETVTTPTELQLDGLAEEIVKANEITATLKAEAEARDKLAEEQAQKDAEDTALRRIEDSMNYIKEQTELIKGTEASDIDIDAFNDFYEVVAEATDVIQSKVTEAISVEGE